MSVRLQRAAVQADVPDAKGVGKKITALGGYFFIDILPKIV